MTHVVLLGDSIFDNAAYVPGQPAVIDQLRARLGAGWRATLRAVDGDVIRDVVRQTRQLPRDASHLVISIDVIQRWLTNTDLGHHSAVYAQPPAVD